MKKHIKTIASFIAFAMLVSGCEAATPAQTSAAATSATTAAPQTSHAAALASEDDAVPEKEQLPLTVALNETNYSYTPFSSTNSYDSFMNNVTGVKAACCDRSGNIVMKSLSGERIEFMGAYYSYSGMSDIEYSYDEENNETTFNIQLRNGVRFTDGEQLTADDLIFTMYVLLDPSYKGSIALGDADIVGAVNYRLNSSIADTISEEDIAEALASEELTEKIKSEIIVPVLREEFQTVKTLYHDSAYDVYTNAYPDPKNLMAFFYSVDSEYRPDPDADDEQMISELADMYGGNYALLGSMVAGSDTYYTDRARSCAVAYITEQEGVTGDVNSVAGIIKTGEYRLAVTVKGSGREFLQELTKVIIAPLHHYGDRELYSYTENRFGFEKGKAAELIAATAGLPLGAGAYSCVKSENGTVYLEANEDYYKGAPLISEIHVTSGTPSNAITAVSDGLADVAFPSYTPASLDEIQRANRSIEKLYLNTARNNGYGYIGINALTVNIGGEPVSEQSIEMRKGIATAIDLYRARSVSEYYGESGEAAAYPVCGNITITGYVSPYELNADGESIYEADMTETQRRKAAKAQCLAHFEAAGYTVEGERIVGVPEGGMSQFTVMIAGGGSGDHPAYAALTYAAELLKEIGITLNIKDISDDTLLWEAISSGTHTIWAGSWGSSLKTAYTSGYYGVDAARMSELLAAVEDAPDRNALTEAYKSCYLYTSDECAVEIPMYKRKTCAVFGCLRVDTATLPQNMTNSYSWTSEIETLNMK